MPRGGARPGTGGARPGAGRPPKRPPVPDAPPRPVFASAKDFGVWALNAADAEVSMDQKIRAMQVLASLEAKQPAQQKPADPAETAETALGGRYAPRRVRGFGVVEGGK